MQQQVANAYPGIYQGILPQCSFQDAWSNGQEIVDYHLDRGYFENPKSGALACVWTPTQIAAVEGHPNYGNTIIFDTVYWKTLGQPDHRLRGRDGGETYNPRNQPEGVRCTLADYMINVFGPRPEILWGRGGEATWPRLRWPVGRQRRRSIRPRRADGRHDHACPIRRPEHEDRRRGHRPQTEPDVLRPNEPALANA